MEEAEEQGRRRGGKEDGKEREDGQRVRRDGDGMEGWKGNKRSRKV